MRAPSYELAELPECVLQHIGELMVTHGYYRSVLCLCRTSRRLKALLQQCYNAVQALRLRWLRDLSAGFKIDLDGQRLTFVGVPRSNAWAAGPLLGPGRWTWRLDAMAGDINVGVCNAECTMAWYLNAPDIGSKGRGRFARISADP